MALMEKTTTIGLVVASSFAIRWHLQTNALNRLAVAFDAVPGFDEALPEGYGVEKYAEAMLGRTPFE